MKISKHVSTTYELTLDNDERFDVTTRTARPMTVRVARIIATQSHQDGEWDLRATGPRVKQDGTLGKVEKLDTWTYENRFTRDVMLRLYDEMSGPVRAGLQDLGVRFDG